MSNDYIEITPKTRKIKETSTEKPEPIKRYNTTNAKTKIKRTKINDWKVVEDKCELYKIFVNGQRRLHHNELFGLSLSLMYLEGGEKKVLETIGKYTELYDEAKDQSWTYWIDYNKKQGYKPKNCDDFCTLKDNCKHYYNMRNTVVPSNAIYVLNNDVSYFNKDEAFKMLLKELRKGVF